MMIQNIFQSDLNFWLSIVFALFLLLIVIRLVFRPAKMFLKLFGRIAIGITILLGVNAITGFIFEFQIAVNAITALVVGLLGLPGLLLLVATFLLVT